MERLSVIAMSPRVGRWNHRYFTATGSRLTEKEAAKQVGDALNPSRPDASIVHADEWVKQVSSGRVNQEVLLVRDPRLTQCPADVREQVESILSDSLPRLGRFVASLTEADGASNLLIWHEGFDELSEDIRRKLEPILSKLAPVDESPDGHVPEPAPRASKTRRLSTPGWFALVGIMALGVVSLLGYGAFSRSTLSSATKDESRNLKHLYFAVVKGLSEDEVQSEFVNKSHEEIVQAILVKLKSGREDASGEHDPTAVNAPPGAPDAIPQPRTWIAKIWGNIKSFAMLMPFINRYLPKYSAEDDLLSLLNEYYAAIYGNKSDRPDELPNDHGFVEKLHFVFKDGKFNPMGALEAKDLPELKDKLLELKQFQCTGRPHFRKVFNAFVGLQEAAKNAVKMKDAADLNHHWQLLFIASFPEEPELSLMEGPDPLLRLYSKEDAEKAHEIAPLLEDFKRLYSAEKARKIVQLLEDFEPLQSKRDGEIVQFLEGFKRKHSDPIAGLRGPDLIAWLREKVRESRDGWETDPLKKSLEVNDVQARVAFQKLKDLTDAWSEGDKEVP